MFEAGLDQAAGLRGHATRGGPVLIPVASPAQPGRAYELLCALAAHLSDQGHAVVILDGTATESERRHSRDGSHLGLLHALQDPSVSGLARPADDADWLVMPAALGVQALAQTVRAGGAAVALSRLLSPFSGGAVLLLFAPAPALAELLEGLPARPLVPLLNQPQATIDAYSALKHLFMAGLAPVLMHQDMGGAVAEQSMQKTMATVQDCALRHLGQTVEAWPCSRWGSRVLEIALHRAPASGVPHPHYGAVLPERRAASMQWS